MWCDFGHEVEEVRVYPIGYKGNLLLCHRHFRVEVARKYKLLMKEEWESLKVYASLEEER